LCYESLTNKPGLCSVCAEKVGCDGRYQMGMTMVDGVDVYFLQVFNEYIRQLIHMLKYQGKTMPGRLLGEALGRRLVAQLGQTDNWIVVPVPLHQARKRERGYNQSAIIARAIGQVSGFQVCENGLKRLRHTPSQTRLDRQARYLNMDSAFGVQNQEKIEGRLVILIDDVVTTGATVCACAHALVGAGAKKVVVAAVARPKLEDDVLP
jgi:ComF family protein